jgi:hypothetical protein
VLALLLLVAGTARGELTVDACGTTVPAGETGRLTADLACGGTAVGVTLEQGTTLRLDGFSIRDTAVAGIDCVAGACTVVGAPGSEIGPCAGHGIVVSSAARVVRRGLVVSDVRILGCTGSGIDAPMAGVVALAVEASGNAGHGIRAWTLRPTAVVTSDNGLHGMTARSKVVGGGVTADANGINGINALEGRVRVLDALVRDNVHAGIAARRLRVDAATVAGNNANAFGIDLFVGRRPRVQAVTCGQSRQLLQTDGVILVGPTWGVCAGD